MKLIHQGFPDTSVPEQQEKLSKQGRFCIFIVKSIYGWCVRADGTKNDAILSRGWKEDYDGAVKWAISHYPTCNIWVREAI